MLTKEFTHKRGCDSSLPLAGGGFDSRLDKRCEVDVFRTVCGRQNRQTDAVLAGFGRFFWITRTGAPWREELMDLDEDRPEALLAAPGYDSDAIL